MEDIMKAQHPAAQSLLTSGHHRFTIRRIGGGDLRKYMTPGRFAEVHRQYVGQAGIRVDVIDTRNGAVQVWDVTLGKWFGSR